VPTIEGLHKGPLKPRYAEIISGRIRLVGDSALSNHESSHESQGSDPESSHEARKSYSSRDSSPSRESRVYNSGEDKTIGASSLRIRAVLLTTRNFPYSGCRITQSRLVTPPLTGRPRWGTLRPDVQSLSGK
jgi:hypothetical protein